jgi:hypothetical protein
MFYGKIANMIDILRRTKTIVGGDRKKGTRGAEGVGKQPGLAGEPTGEPTSENKRIMSNKIDKDDSPRTPRQRFYGIG